MNSPAPHAPALASRVADIEPFHVVEVVTRAMALQAQGRSIVNLAIGEPDAAPAAPIAEAGIAAIRAGQTRYTQSLGLPALREAIAGWYRTRHGVALPPGRVAVMPGSSGALLITMAVLLSPGDEVLMADPSYPCNRHFTRAMEGRAVALPVGPEAGYQLTAAQVARHWGPRTRAVMIASPSNPTGTVIHPDELRAIHAEVRARGGTLVVDEIYHGVSYGGPDRSVLEFADDAVVINSFSKYFGMTGWRLGWMVAPEALIPAVEKLAQNFFISASEIAQRAAIAAFSPEAVAVHEARREAFQAQRDYLLPRLRELGFTIPVEPQGAFYIYAGCEAFSRDSQAFCLELLENAGVAVAPGLDFGSHEASTHVRFSYPKPIPVLAEGVDRLARHLAGRRSSSATTHRG